MNNQTRLSRRRFLHIGWEFTVAAWFAAIFGTGCNPQQGTDPAAAPAAVRPPALPIPPYDYRAFQSLGMPDAARIGAFATIDDFVAAQGVAQPYALTNVGMARAAGADGVAGWFTQNVVFGTREAFIYTGEEATRLYQGAGIPLPAGESPLVAVYKKGDTFTRESGPYYAIVNTARFTSMQRLASVQANVNATQTRLAYMLCDLQGAETPNLTRITMSLPGAPPAGLANPTGIQGEGFRIIPVGSSLVGANPTHGHVLYDNLIQGSSPGLISTAASSDIDFGIEVTPGSRLDAALTSMENGQSVSLDVLRKYPEILQGIRDGSIHVVAMRNDGGRVYIYDQVGMRMVDDAEAAGLEIGYTTMPMTSLPYGATRVSNAQLDDIGAIAFEVGQGWSAQRYVQFPSMPGQVYYWEHGSFVEVPTGYLRAMNTLSAISNIVTIATLATLGTYNLVEYNLQLSAGLMASFRRELSDIDSDQINQTVFQYMQPGTAYCPLELLGFQQMTGRDYSRNFRPIQQIEQEIQDAGNPWEGLVTKVNLTGGIGKDNDAYIVGTFATDENGEQVFIVPPFEEGRPPTVVRAGRRDQAAVTYIVKRDILGGITQGAMFSVTWGPLTEGERSYSSVTGRQNDAFIFQPVRSLDTVTQYLQNGQ